MKPRILIAPAPLKEIEQFFITYNKEKGRKFKVLKMRGPRQALKLVKKGLR